MLIYMIKLIFVFYIVWCKQSKALLTRNKLLCIVKEVTGLGLKEAKAIADNGGAVKEGIAKEEAEALKAQLEEAGATVELQ